MFSCRSSRNRLLLLEAGKPLFDLVEDPKLKHSELLPVEDHLGNVFPPRIRPRLRWQRYEEWTERFLARFELRRSRDLESSHSVQDSTAVRPVHCDMNLVWAVKFVLLKGHQSRHGDVQRSWELGSPQPRQPTAEDVKQSFPDGSRIAEKDGWQFHECGRPKK